MSISNARIIIDGLSNQNLKRDEFLLNSDGTWSNNISYNLANADDLSNVAFTGSYNDLADKPSSSNYTAGNHIDITDNVISAHGYVHSDNSVPTSQVTQVVTNDMIATGTITADKFATGEVLKLTLSTSDIGEGSPLASNTLYGVYK